MVVEQDYSALKQLTEGKFTDLKKMKMAELREEVQMWRNLWGWIPTDVKFYASRTGSSIGLQVRNYHRFVGVLLDTRWELKYVDVGVYEKVYDQNDGQYYFERKIVRIPLSQIVAFDWIASRESEESILMEKEELPDEPPSDITL